MENLSSKYRMSAVNITLALSVSLLSACGGEATQASAATNTTTEPSINTSIETESVSNNSSNNSEPADTITESTENLISFSAEQPNTNATTSETTETSVQLNKSKPKIWLSFSKSGNTFAKGTSLTVTAHASDGDGKILRVGFYHNGKWIAKDTTAPFTFNWSSDKPGTHYLYAQTTDNDKLSTRSATHTITITETKANEKPVVSLLSPSGDTNIDAGSNVLLSAKAFDNDGSVSKVAFYANGKWLAKTEVSPYTFEWKNIPEGEHAVYAVATDDKFGMTYSTSAKIIANKVPDPEPPSVQLMSPTELTSIEQGTAIKISAEADDSDGSVSKVDFYSNGKLIATDKTAPYTYSWTTEDIGDHDIYALATDNEGLSTFSKTHTVTITEKAAGSLTTYPVPDIIEHLHKSNRFGVRVYHGNQSKNSFVYRSENTAKPNWEGTFDYMQDANHWTTFSFDGEVTVEARRLDGQSISSCTVRPKTLGIKPDIQGNKCIFTLTEQVQISVEIDEPKVITQAINGIGTVTKEIVKNPLFVFAEALEQDAPTASGDGVIYFGPGIHEIGKNFLIPNNTEVYIAGGAYVIGTLTAGKNPANIRIRGRGILSGKGLQESHSEHNSWNNHAITFTSGNKGYNLEIDGITITDPIRSCIVSYNTVDIRNLKLFSWNHRNDGIVAGNNSIIEKSFIKVQDDNLKLYYSNQTIRDLVIWQQTAGAVFKFSWDLKRVAQNNLIENIDIIHSDVFTDYTTAEVDRPDLQSTSAVFSSMGFQEGAAFQNNTFRGIRIEEKHLLRLMSLRMVSTHQSPTSTSTWGDSDPTAKKLIRNVVIEDLSLNGTPYKQSTLYGNMGGTISDIQFRNLTVGNTLINNKWEFNSRLDGIGFLTAGNVSNLNVSQH